MYLKGVSFFLSLKFQLDFLSRFRIVEENRKGAYFAPPPGKIGLNQG